MSLGRETTLFLSRAEMSLGRETMIFLSRAEMSLGRETTNFLSRAETTILSVGADNGNGNIATLLRGIFAVTPRVRFDETHRIRVNGHYVARYMNTETPETLPTSINKDFFGTSFELLWIIEIISREWTC
jgi:hypothetical protein